jgi:hypothetical protein
VRPIVSGSVTSLPSMNDPTGMFMLATYDN